MLTYITEIRYWDNTRVDEREWIQACSKTTSAANIKQLLYYVWLGSYCTF